MSPAKADGANFVLAIGERQTIIAPVDQSPSSIPHLSISAPAIFQKRQNLEVRVSNWIFIDCIYDLPIGKSS